jgi:LysM repeat protein
MESDSATHKTNMSKLSTRQLKKDKMPFVLMGAGLLALIIFFAVLFPREERPREKEQAEPAPGRLEQLETRLSKLEWMSGKIEQLEDREKAFESYRDRLEKLEETLSSRMEHLEKRMENFQKRGYGSRSADTAPRQPVKVPETRKPSVKTGARYHIVGAGETLYQIGRKYGVAVDALRRFNQLSPGTAIHPGQKILLTPSGSE